MRTVFWQDHTVRMIDQRRLPEALEVLTLRDAPAVAAAIRDMAIRGAPAIGAAAAYGLALAAATSPARDVAGMRGDLESAAAILRAARPTAVNLGWAIDRVLHAVDESLGAADVSLYRTAVTNSDSADALRAFILAEAERIADADVATNRRMGANGAALLPDEATVIHHCNTGALAAVDYGTALGVVRAAHEAGKRIHVLVDETRPRLQGAKLTTWELGQLGIPHTLIVDGAAGYHLASGRVAAVLVGADRVAANGDTANKIGTYPLAVVARENGVPFYVVAPTTTVDLAAPDGAAIPIEMRDPAEVTHIGGVAISPAGTAAANPAFDITPHRYISAIVTEAGVVRPPYDSGLLAAVRMATTTDVALADAAPADAAPADAAASTRIAAQATVNPA
jgi:methylthioribose-1-phosphate isomerase